MNNPFFPCYTIVMPKFICSIDKPFIGYQPYWLICMRHNSECIF